MDEETNQCSHISKGKSLYPPKLPKKARSEFLTKGKVKITNVKKYKITTEKFKRKLTLLIFSIYYLFKWVFLVHRQYDLYSNHLSYPEGVRS